MSAPGPNDPQPGRRSFLKLLNLAIGGAITAVLAIPLVRYFIFPARRRIVEGPGDAVPVARAADVGQKPLRVEITIAEQRDAWAKQENVRLGAAWLLKDASGAIRAFTTTCPHLGCAVDYDEKNDRFQCPCHTSAFDKDGNRLAGPAKRGMDPLETSIDADGRVLVKFVRYRPDTPSREVA